MRHFLLAAVVVFSPAIRAADPPKVVTQTFQVIDLVTPIPDCTLPADKNPADKVKAQSTQDGAAKLVRTVTTIVKPHTWDALGGPGKIEYSDIAHTLVVSTTPEVMKEVAALLAALRKLQDTSVVTEVRVISMPVGFRVRCGVDCCDGAVMSGRDVKEFLELVQANRAANVLQFPKVTTFDGQVANIRFGEQSFERVGVDWGTVYDQPAMLQKTITTVVGDSLSLCGRVGADGKSVLLRAHLARTSACDETPRVAERTATVPDGRTLVVGSWKETARTSFGPPVISKIPYLNRLFKNVGIEEREVLVLAMTRVVVPEPVPAPPVVPAAAEVAKPEVELRMTFLRVPEDFMGKLGMSPDSPNGARVWTVTPRELEMLSVRLREAQSAGSIDVLSTPRVRVLDGQTGSVKVGGTASYVTGLDVTVKDGEAVVVPRKTEVPHGLSAEVTPTVSADGKFVRVNLSASYSVANREAKRVPVTVPVTPIFEGGSRAPVPVQQFVEEVPPQDTQSFGANFAVPAKGTVILGGLLVKPDVVKGQPAPKPIELLIVVTPQVAEAKPGVVPASASPVTTDLTKY